MFRKIIKADKKIYKGESNYYSDDLNKLSNELTQFGISQFLIEEIRKQSQQEEILLKKLEQVDYDVLEQKMKRIHLDKEDQNQDRFQQINEGMIDQNEKQLYKLYQEQDNNDQNETSTLEDEQELNFSGIQNISNNNNNDDEDEEEDNYSDESSIQLIEIGDLSYDIPKQQQYIKKDSINDNKIRKSIKKLKLQYGKIKENSINNF